MPGSVETDRAHLEATMAALVDAGPAASRDAARAAFGALRAALFDGRVRAAEPDSYGDATDGAHAAIERWLP